MMLEQFSAEYTGIEDFSPLTGMPLRRVALSTSKIHDLVPFRGAPLEFLETVGTSVTDLSPLAGAPLNNLRTGARMMSLEPLRGMPLKDALFTCRDYSPLEGMQMESLDLAGTSAPSLLTLPAFKVNRLRIAATNPNDLTALRHVDVKVLNMFGVNNPNLSLAPLLDCVGMEEIDIGQFNGVIEPLRRHPGLKRICWYPPGQPQRPMMPVEQFWAEYDALPEALKPK
jgi:hypothetical protein